MSRKPTLVYDPDFPAQPPQFASFDRATKDFSGFDRQFEGNETRGKDGRGLTMREQLRGRGMISRGLMGTSLVKWRVWKTREKE